MLSISIRVPMRRPVHSARLFAARRVFHSGAVKRTIAGSVHEIPSSQGCFQYQRRHRSNLLTDGDSV